MVFALEPIAAAELFSAEKSKIFNIKRHFKIQLVRTPPIIMTLINFDKHFFIFIDVVKQKGLDNITVEDLVLEMVPKGRALVPDSVKKELLQRIRTFLASQTDLF
jgi:hypothetical protein